MLRVVTDEETKEYHLKKLFELSKLERAKLEFRVDGSILKNGKPIAHEPNDEQIGKMKAPARAWQRWFVGLYFTEEQKKQLGLTDEDIAGRGMR
jgi:hypothetical protein